MNTAVWKACRLCPFCVAIRSAVSPRQGLRDFSLGVFFEQNPAAMATSISISAFEAGPSVPSADTVDDPAGQQIGDRVQTA